MKNLDNNIMIYQDKDGITKVSVKFIDEDIWITKYQIADIYKTTRQNIEQHIKNIYNDRELDENATCKNFLQVQKEGSREVKRNIDHYNLDMIIALGYRVQSEVAVRFRIWATKRLHEYIQKGFAMDDERLKQGGNRYFRELLQRIRDIRSSERNFYQQVTDIYATSVDYNPRSDITKKFFATVQNKLHFAVHEHTAAELIYERVNNEKPYVGMTNFSGNYVTLEDTKIAKNYLSEIELQRLNLLVSQFLDYAELQALEQRPMNMTDWVVELDNQIKLNRKKILEGNGKITHEEAIEKAEREFELYRKREMETLESDFDKMVKLISNNTNSNKYYRITYNGEGIYDALKNSVDLETWKNILSSENISWLPKPPTYSSNNTSYFTEKGYEEFSSRAMPIIVNYLKKGNIKVDEFDKLSSPIIYTDEYQVVVIDDK